MSKEMCTISSDEVQRNLWGKICGEQGITKRVTQAMTGHLPNGLTLPEILKEAEGFSSVLGEFAPRVLIASNPNNPFALVPEQIAVAGGWCALRTKDVAGFNEKGVIMNPENGAIEQIRSVDQVADWIQKAATFDQIIESIGSPKAAEYVVISEKKLWTQRITAKLSQIFNRQLSEEEKDKIEEAIDQTEKDRALMTKRYLGLATGNENLVFQRVVDEDIWEDLEKAKNEMLERAGLSIDGLCNAFPNETPIIKSTALVWAMYSEPYFEILRTRGFITKKNVFIVEPSLHTYADNFSGNKVVQTIYQDKGVYFDKGGINPNTGFIAFMECLTPDGINVRKNLGVAEVPNVTNWPRLFDGGILDPEKNAVVNPKDNLLFIWGVNFLPFGQTRQRLLELIILQETFLEEKKKNASLFSKSAQKDKEVRESVQRKTEELRQLFLVNIRGVNEQIALDLKNLFKLLTKGIVINL